MELKVSAMGCVLWSLQHDIQLRVNFTRGWVFPTEEQKSKCELRVELSDDFSTGKR